MDDLVLDPAVLAELRELSTPDDNVLAEVIAVFLSEVPDQLRAVGDAVAAGDSAALQRLAHRLQGSARGVGAGQLGEATAAIEAAARAGDLPAATAAAAHLADLFDTVRAALERETR